jgi:hypothetical protein
MFKTMVMVCALHAPDQCVTFEDTIKLRETKIECYNRAVEMVQQVTPTIPVPFKVMYKCEEQKSV